MVLLQNSKTNSKQCGSDEMAHCESSHLVLNCLQRRRVQLNS